MTALDSLQTGSFLYTLDPRTKILLVLLCTVLVFIVDNPLAAAGQMFVFFGLWLAAKMPLAKIGAYLKWLSFLIVLIVVLQMLFGPDPHNGPYILKPLIPEAVPFIGGAGSLKRDGLVLGLTIGCRLVTLVCIMPMLTMTTPAHQLAMGFTGLGMHYRAAYIITSALNLIPSFEDEARAIMEARKLRGMRAFEDGGLLDKLKEYPALALPLIVNAMRRAQIMGIAMDARAFGAYRQKTWLEKINMTGRDYAAIAVSLAYTVLVVVLQRAL
jgi:energy-coupling factor transport system permease protein